MTLQRERPKFFAAVLGTATLALWSIPAFADSVRVRNIQVSETAGNTAVVIASSARPTFTTWKLEQPARVVVELSGARLGNVEVPLDAGTYAVGLVSASVTEDDSAGPRTRIVLTLRQTSDYQVEAKGNDITLRVIPRVRPPTAAPETAVAHEQAEASAKAEARARNQAQAKERAEAQARTEAQAKTEAQARANTEAQAKAEAQAQAKAEAQAKTEAQAQAKAEARAKTEAQAQAKAEARAKTEAQAQAKAEAQAKTEAQAQAKAEAQAKTEAQAQAKAEARAKTEAQAQAKAEAQAKTEAQAQAKAETQAKTEAQAQAKAEAQERALAQARAEAQAKLTAKAQNEAHERAEAQRKTEALLKDESKERLAAQAVAEERSRAEQAARLESDRLRRELADAHRETAKARAEASAANQESHRQKLALAQAETQVKHAQSEAERARKRADAAESESAAAKRRETERDNAVRLASDEVAARQKTLDRIAQKQQEQQDRLASAERLVSDRENTVRGFESRLAEREEEARVARARRDSLARDASKSSKAEAAAALAEAERQKKSAATAAEQSHQDLARAVSSRRQEEARKDEQSSLRRAEESQLEKAIALRKAEEVRLADARAERSRIDAERSKLESERAQLETARNTLLAEVNRLKTTAVATAALPAKPESARGSQHATAGATQKPALTASAPEAHTGSLPNPPAMARVEQISPAPHATKPAPVTSPAIAKPMLAAEPANKPAPTSTGRPRSVTLRALSHIRSIDFIDEPSRASVIIDVDDSAMFSVERLAGRRLSLRIEHSELPESLARNLDATEYLGPVKIISSYRDPAARTTVRVDVDLAEDVPNRVRVDGSRIFWDFQKTQAPSLPAVWVRPPAVMFVRARKVAGFVAMFKDGLWLGQNAPLPYLAPPVQPTPSAGNAPAVDTGSTPASAAPTTSAPEARQGGGATGPSGRFATIGKKRYTGRRIDLDFKGADIHNILRLLADVGQVNVIVADDVRGEVTIKMRDVPWDQALDVVLRSKGLGSVREGNLLRVAPLALLEKELEAEIARQKQIADVLPIETRLIGVSYADAAQLMDKIRDLLSPRGKVSEDHRTNTLIVSDVTKNLQLIEDLVRNLDTQTSQVVIEARIVEANSDFTRQIGVQWGGTGFADTTHGNPTGLVFPYNVGVGGGADDGTAPLGGLVPGPRTGTGTTGNPNFLVNMPVSTGLGTGAAIGLTLGSVAGAFNLNLRLSAMESTGTVRILSSPRITTMDNVMANITQGVSIPVSVVSAMGAQTQFVDAQLMLSVKPHVTNEGTISMVINITRNEPDFVNTGARGDPSIQKKEAKTTMLVRDGDTAVIGGIYTRNTGLAFARVPFFSDIPVLGWFFRNRKENDNRSEFLVFITPRIVNRSRVAGQ